MGAEAMEGGYPESDGDAHVSDVRILARSDLNTLIDVLVSAGYRVIGPTVREDAVVLEDVKSDADLPVGWRDDQAGGEYRLRKVDDQRVFAFADGPHSLKRFLFVPRRQILSVDRGADLEIRFSEPVDPPEKLAVLGARPCDVAAAQVQDLTFLGDGHPDSDYARRRATTFIIVVNCSHPASTCFCASMGTGPRAKRGFDLAITELCTDDRHEFVIEAGSVEGAAILERLSTRPASEQDMADALDVTARAEDAISKSLNTENIRDVLLGSLDHPAWQAVAERCLSCTNCTLVCPTCFCHTIEDVTDLSGDHAERWQIWDSCFTVDHSYIHGGSVRKSTKSRYRQWMTHKLASWIDQYGTSGCVGCGRCITWCPVGIDITEEVEKIRSNRPKKKQQSA